VKVHVGDQDNNNHEVTRDESRAEDVAALYSWANLEGANYRDFSAERQHAHLQNRNKPATGKPAEIVIDSGVPSDIGNSPGDPDAAEEQLHPDASPSAPSQADDPGVRSGDQRWKSYRAFAEIAAESPVAMVHASDKDQIVDSVFPPEDSLQNPSPEWPLLRDLLAGAQSGETMAGSANSLSFAPLIFASVSGGAGKTNLVANLGCALASAGESALLVESSPVAVLPYYFGASESRTGVARTFASDSEHAPVHVLTLDWDECGCGPTPCQQVYEAIMTFGKERLRVILDVSSDPADVLRQILPLEPVVIVPVVPDTRSVLGLKVIEDLLDHQRQTASSKGPRHYFLLNRFDSSQTLHRNIREMMQKRFGDKLLPFVIRESSLVDEALAHGVSVVDYAPGSGVAQDIHALMEWVRSTICALSSAARLPRWSER
jgi:cellulose biosynthesis protein BcsQ